jgi:hypothetical protein
VTENKLFLFSTQFKYYSMLFWYSNAVVDQGFLQILLLLRISRHCPIQNPAFLLRTFCMAACGVVLSVTVNWFVRNHWLTRGRGAANVTPGFYAHLSLLAGCINRGWEEALFCTLYLTYR